MVRPELAIFPILITILIESNVIDAKLSDSSFGLLSKILGKYSRSPLVVVVDTPSESNNHLLRSSHDQPLRSFNDAIDEEKTLRYVSDILRSTGDENDPDVAETNLKFQNALRSRCEAYLECKIKCRPKKTKDKCKKSCQDVFDYLMTCNPPGKKKTYDFCGPKCGKTMPPNW